LDRSSRYDRGLGSLLLFVLGRCGEELGKSVALGGGGRRVEGFSEMGIAVGVEAANGFRGSL